MDFLLIAPELIFLTGILSLLIYGVLGGKNMVFYGKGLVILVGVALLWVAVSFPPSSCWSGLYRVDPFALLGKAMAILTLLVILLASDHVPRIPELRQFENLLLWFLATLGMMVMVSAADLMTLFLGIELQSLSLYILVAFQRTHGPATQAALKYFLLGALATGLLLYGASLLYGYTGATSYEGIQAALHQDETQQPLLILVAISLMVAGIAFKISLAPFHSWVPDVYEHTPTLTTTFLAGAPKVAAVMVLIRLLAGPFGGFSDYWQILLSGLSIVSMLFMSITALKVTNLQRLMAFSGISHMGYAVVGLIPGNEAAIHNTLIYLLVYLVGTTGFFISLLSLHTYRQGVHNLADLKGLALERPVTTFFLSVFVLSLAGIPPFAGFFGKFYVFLSAIESGAYEAATLGLLSSVIGAFYYLRLIKTMYFDEGAEEQEGRKDQALGVSRRSFFGYDFKMEVILLLMGGFCLLFFAISQPFMALTKDVSLSLLAH
jgi:NADH-quinone oxidoreductase subunit N